MSFALDKPASDKMPYVLVSKDVNTFKQRNNSVQTGGADFSHADIGRETERGPGGERKVADKLNISQPLTSSLLRSHYNPPGSSSGEEGYGTILIKARSDRGEQSLPVSMMVTTTTNRQPG